MADRGAMNPIVEVLRLVKQQADTLNGSRVSSEGVGEYRQRSIQIKMLVRRLSKQGIDLRIWGPDCL